MKTEKSNLEMDSFSLENFDLNQFLLVNDGEIGTGTPPYSYNLAGEGPSGLQTPEQPTSNGMIQPLEEYNFKREDYVSLSPQTLVISLTPWAGNYNFQAQVPVLCKKLKGKNWGFSTKLNRVYTDIDRLFPVEISMNCYPPNAVVSFCLVYINPGFSTIPVNRCATHLQKDKDSRFKDYLLQIQGRKTTYYMQDNRCIVDTPLGEPTVGDECITMYCQLGCHTSCPSGPERKLFALHITVKDEYNRVLGRQIIHTKCCAGPKRDMKNDEKRADKENPPTDLDDEQNEIDDTACGLLMVQQTVVKKVPHHNKRKRLEDDSEYVTIRVPKKYERKMKKYANELAKRTELKKMNLLKTYRIFSEFSSSE